MCVCVIVFVVCVCRRLFVVGCVVWLVYFVVSHCVCSVDYGCALFALLMNVWVGWDGQMCLVVCV